MLDSKDFKDAVKSRFAGTGLEIVFAGLLLAMVMAAQIWIAHPGVEYKQGFWYDEYLTYIVASDSSPSHAINALRAGMDGMPPLYYEILRVVARIGGSDPKPIYRACSTVAMWMALLAAYATLRYALDVRTSAVAVLVFWMNPLIVRYAFEARPYAMMLAGIACVAWGLRLKGWASTIVVMLSAAFACTIHYLGIIPVSLMLVAEVAFGPDSIKERLGRIAPGVFGTFALVFDLPLMIAQHRNLGPTWVSPFNPHEASDLIMRLFNCLPLVALLVAWWISRVFGKADEPIEPSAFRRLSPLFAMLGIPLILVAISKVGESLMVDRYFIATLLGMPALVGLVLAETNARLKIVLLACFLAASTAHVASNASRLKLIQNLTDIDARELSQEKYGLVAACTVEAFPIWFSYPSLRPRIAVIDLPPQSYAALPRQLGHMQHVEGNTENLYDLPPRWDATTIAKNGRFRLWGPGEFLPAIKQWTSMVQVDPDQDLYEVRR